MKAYLKGRQSVLGAVKKSKYQQILQSVRILDYKTIISKYLFKFFPLKELESRDMKKTVSLSVTYHVHDIIGADLVTW